MVLSFSKDFVSSCGQYAPSSSILNDTHLFERSEVRPRIHPLMKEDIKLRSQAQGRKVAYVVLWEHKPSFMLGKGFASVRPLFPHFADAPLGQKCPWRS